MTEQRVAHSLDITVRLIVDLLAVAIAAYIDLVVAILAVWGEEVARD